MPKAYFGFTTKLRRVDIVFVSKPTWNTINPKENETEQKQTGLETL